MAKIQARVKSTIFVEENNASNKIPLFLLTFSIYHFWIIKVYWALVRKISETHMETPK